MSRTILVRSRGAVQAKLKLGEVSCSEGKAERDVTLRRFEVRLPGGHVYRFKVVSIFGNTVQRASNRRDRGPTTFALSASATATKTPRLLSRRPDIDD